MSTRIGWLGWLVFCGGCMRAALSPTGEPLSSEARSSGHATPENATVAGLPVEAGSTAQVSGLDLLTLPERELVLNPSWRRTSTPPPAPAAQVVDKANARRTDPAPPAPPTTREERKPFLRPALETTPPPPRTTEKEKTPSGPAEQPEVKAPATSLPTPAPVAAAPVRPRPTTPAAPLVVEPEREVLASATPAHEEQVEPVEPETPDAEQVQVREDEAQAAPPPIPADARFQIQIMSTSDPEQAEDMRQQALLVFPGEHVEVVWDPPNYKVRVGALVTQEAAVDLKRRALRLGFQNAWVVPRRMP